MESKFLKTALFAKVLLLSACMISCDCSGGTPDKKEKLASEDKKQVAEFKKTLEEYGYSPTQSTAALKVIESIKKKFLWKIWIR